MTTGRTIALTIRIFVSKVTPLLLSTVSRFVIAFLSRSKSLLILWLQSPDCSQPWSGVQMRVWSWGWSWEPRDARTQAILLIFLLRVYPWILIKLSRKFLSLFGYTRNSTSSIFSWLYPPGACPSSLPLLPPQSPTLLVLWQGTELVSWFLGLEEGIPTSNCSFPTLNPSSLFQLQPAPSFPYHEVTHFVLFISLKNLFIYTFIFKNLLFN